MANKNLLIGGVLVAMVFLACLTSGARGNRAAYRDYASWTRAEKTNRCERTELSECCPYAKALRSQRQIISNIVNCAVGLVTNVLSFNFKIPPTCCQIPIFNLICSFLPSQRSTTTMGPADKSTTTTTTTLGPVDKSTKPPESGLFPVTTNFPFV